MRQRIFPGNLHNIRNETQTDNQELICRVRVFIGILQTHNNKINVSFGDLFLEIISKHTKVYSAQKRQKTVSSAPAFKCCSGLLFSYDHLVNFPAHCFIHGIK